MSLSKAKNEHSNVLTPDDIPPENIMPAIEAPATPKQNITVQIIGKYN